MKKTNKIFAVFLTLTIVLTGLVKTVSVEAKNNSYYSTINQNVRTLPKDFASPVIYLAEGEKVEYIEEANANWFKVKYEGKEGYVDRGDLTSEKNYLDPETTIFEVDTTKKENADTHYIAPTDVNLRSRNVRNASSLALVNQGKKVSYHGTTNNGWFLVEYGDKKGYIHRSDLTSYSKYEEGNREYQEVDYIKEQGFDKLEVIIDQSLRTKDNKNYASIVSVPRMAEVQYIGTTNNDWFLVDYMGTKGYIYRGDLTAIKQAEMPEVPEEKPEEKPESDDITVTSPNGKNYEITAFKLNLRAGNNTSYDSLAQISKGEVVKHLGTANNGWYKVDYNGIIGFISSNSKYIKERKTDASLNGSKVFMDYGHGGTDPGAIGFGWRREKDDTLRLGLLVTKNLRDKGVLVDEFRNNDPNRKLELWHRTNMANKKNYDYFVSIHRNSHNGKARGVETFTYRRSGQKANDLAEVIQKNLVKLGFINRGTKEAGFYVLKHTKAPAVLVEAGFIDNASDNKMFDNKINEIAKAISDGVITEIKRNN